MRFERRRALRYLHPGLRAAHPGMECRFERAGIVQCAGFQADLSGDGSRLVMNSRAAIRTERIREYVALAAVASEGFETSPGQHEMFPGYAHRHAESAAGLRLTDGAMAGIDNDRRAGHPVTDGTAFAAAFEGRRHVPFRHDRFLPHARPDQAATGGAIPSIWTR